MTFFAKLFFPRDVVEGRSGENRKNKTVTEKKENRENNAHLVPKRFLDVGALTLNTRTKKKKNTQKLNNSGSGIKIFV